MPGRIGWSGNDSPHTSFRKWLANVLRSAAKAVDTDEWTKEDLEIKRLVERDGRFELQEFAFADSIKEFSVALKNLESRYERLMEMRGYRGVDPI